MKRLTALILLAAALSGCAGRPGRVPPGKAPAPKTTVAEEIRTRISRQVLHGISDRGRFRRVRSTGILTVALPPLAPPFQFRDATGALQGFNVDVAGEIASALMAKANIEVLDAAAFAVEAARCGAGRYDIVFLAPASPSEKPDASVPYFYSRADNGWWRICAGPEKTSLRRAVVSTLSYMNESGVFFQLYLTHFGAGPGGSK